MSWMPTEANTNKSFLRMASAESLSGSDLRLASQGLSPLSTAFFDSLLDKF